MTFPEDSPLWDKLALWEELRLHGQDDAAEELCRDCPEILPQLKAAIRALKGTDWLARPVVEEPADPDDSPSVFSVPPPDFGEYHLLERIGAGGMGRVYKALHRRMDRIVAVKVLPETLVNDASSLERFRQEVRSAARLTHTNIVTAYDAGEHDGEPFLVMEHVEGVDLLTHVQRHGPLPAARAVDCVVQAARGLSHAHEKGILHRDIKPANLLLGGDGTVKILDMGLACLYSDHSNEEALAGTVDYIAPERTIVPRHDDVRSEVYSLGCTFFFLLTGRAVFPGSSIIEKVLGHREAPVPSLQGAVPGVSKKLDAVFRRMVAKRPGDRYQSMDRVIEALSTACERPKNGERSKARPLALLVVLAAAAIFGVLFLADWWRKAPDDGRAADPGRSGINDAGNTPGATADGWVSLFNGKDLSGWKAVEGRVRNWGVEDGILSTNRTGIALRSDRGDYRDFHLRLEAKLGKGCYGGVGFRSWFGDPETIYPDGFYVSLHGKVRMNEPPGTLWATKTSDPFLRTRLALATGVEAFEPEAWHMLEVVATGKRLLVRIDGKRVVDFMDSGEGTASGHFFLHAGADPFNPNLQHQSPVVQYRKVQVKEQQTFE